jgi:Big-like domain-containing protein
VSFRLGFLFAAATAAVMATACDNDPTGVRVPLSVACPTGTQDVNSPIRLVFSSPVAANTVTSANVVVLNTATGLQIPGALAVNEAAPSEVVFTPSSKLAFNTALRVRVQNVRDSLNTAVDVQECPLLTSPPPIAELFWRQIPSAGGNAIVGISLISPTLGYALSQPQPLYRREGEGEFTVVAAQPYFANAADVAFVSREHGFAAFVNVRTGRSIITETEDAGVTFDSLAPVVGEAVTRTYFRATAGTPPNDVFGVVGAGRLNSTIFLKYQPATKTFVSQGLTGSAQVSDIDFATDTLIGAAVSSGVKIGTTDFRGRAYTSADGGSTWTAIANSLASDAVQFYRGVAVRENGEIFVVGGNGYIARLDPDGSGGYTTTVVTQSEVANPDPNDAAALVFSDIQFAPNDDTKGWLVGGQRTGVVNGVPQYRGVILHTIDGGRTFVRQGVRDAPNFGAEFPRLTRLSVLSDLVAWVAGDGGFVAEYKP